MPTKHLKLALATGFVCCSIGLTAYGLYDTMTPSAAQNAALSPEIQSLLAESDKDFAEIKAISGDLGQLADAIPQQLAQIQLEALSNERQNLVDTNNTLMAAQVALSLMDLHGTDDILTDENRQGIVPTVKLLDAMQADLVKAIFSMDDEMTELQSQIPPGGPTLFPTVPVSSVAAMQAEARRLFAEAGISIE